MTIELQVSAISGSETGKVDLSDAAFGARFNEPLIHQVVIAYQAGGRQGTRAQKNRAAVRGGGAKPQKQKGSGSSRKGTIRSPIFRGGGRIFPASTKDFSQKVNKKMYRAAMCSILSELTRQERLVVIDDLVLESPKTRTLVETLHRLNADRALIVLSENNGNIALSARNLQTVSVRTCHNVDPVSLIRHDKVVMTVAAAKHLDQVLQRVSVGR